MKYINQFNQIINDEKVLEKVRFFLNEGKQYDLFLNYFGVNYDDENVVSVKFYFSYFDEKALLLLSSFSISDEVKKMIRANWKPSNTYAFMHQGLTYGLKCYLKEGTVVISEYIHFRTSKPVLGLPNNIEITENELFNSPGICCELYKNENILKKYFYLNSDDSKKKIFNRFGLLIDYKNVDVVEYTETDTEEKINICFLKADDVKAVLEQDGNRNILDLSFYLFEKFKLYYFAPGYRLNSKTRAIYFVSKVVYYNASFPIQTLNCLF